MWVHTHAREEKKSKEKEIKYETLTTREENEMKNKSALRL
jgi:hypothetical protein